MRKIEFTRIQLNNDTLKFDVCPLCNAPFHVKSSAADSTVETTAVESAIELNNGMMDEFRGEKK